MSKRLSLPGWFALFGLLTFACQIGSGGEIIPTAEPSSSQQATEIPITPPPTPNQFENSDAPVLPNLVADAISIERLETATVLILAQRSVAGRMETMWTGSGTIITPHGLILTNAHVAAPESPGLAALYNDPELLFSETVDRLVIALGSSADRPPTERYIAETRAADGHLDLAAVQIVSDLDGNSLSPNELDLPFVPVGDSDAVRLGDEIRLLGFPGAGGETITFTRGDVSGFESQARVGDRAWIKTDATFSPGNSGGLGVNQAGQLIGVPSFVLEAQGGAINRLRAVNLAAPLIEAAKNGTTYESPYLAAGTGAEQLQLIAWAEDYDDVGCATQHVTRYSSDSLAAVAVFQYKGLMDGEQILELWYVDDELTASFVYEWESGERGTCFPVYLHNFGEPLDAGMYTVEIYAGDDLDLISEADVAVGWGSAASGNLPTTASNSVLVEGAISDAVSGKPIEGAAIFILYPGSDLDNWLDRPADDEIFTFAESDANGEYRLPDALPRGKSYPGIVAATGYRSSDGYLDITAADPETVIVDVELNR